MTTVLYWGHHVQVCCPYVYISPARHWGTAEKPPHWGDGLIQCLAERESKERRIREVSPKVHSSYQMSREQGL